MTPNTDQVKFWFQYKFRHTSISYIFFKEFVCSGLLVGLFQFINFKYLEFFN